MQNETQNDVIRHQINAVLGTREFEHMADELIPIFVRFIKLSAKYGDSFALRQYIGFQLIHKLYDARKACMAIKQMLYTVFALTPEAVVWEFSAALAFCGYKHYVTLSQLATFQKYAFLRPKRKQLLLTSPFTIFDITQAGSPVQLMLEMSEAQLDSLAFPYQIVFLPRDLLVIDKTSRDLLNLQLIHPEPCQCGNCGVLDNEYDFSTCTLENMVEILRRYRCTCVVNYVNHLVQNDLVETLHKARKMVHQRFFRLEGRASVRGAGPVSCLQQICNYPLEIVLECYHCLNPVYNVAYGSACAFVLKQAEYGFGIFAAHDIPRNTLICEYCGELIANVRTYQRGNLYDSWRQSYFYDLGKGSLFSLDALQFGNAGRWINHSKTPNVYPLQVLYCSIGPTAMPLVWFYAYRKISKNEELFIDYGYPEDVADVYPWSQ